MNNQAGHWKSKLEVVALASPDDTRMRHDHDDGTTDLLKRSSTGVATICENG